jgi:hypothetical protein
MQLFVSVTQPEEFNEVDLHEMQENLPSLAVETHVDFQIKKIFPLFQTPLLNRLTGNAQPAAYLLFEKLNTLIDHHARHMKEVEYNRHKLDCYPLAEVWRTFYRNEITGFPTLLQLLFVLATNWGEGRNYKVYEFMNREFLPEIRKFYGFDLHGLKNALARLPHINTINTVLQWLGEENWDAAYAHDVAGNILASFFPLLDKANARKEFVHETYTKKELRTVFIHQHSCISYWMSDVFGRKDSEKAFAGYFMLRYQFYRKSDCLTTSPPVALSKSPLSIFDFAQACTFGLVSEAEVCRELQERVNAEESLHLASAFLFDRLKAWQRNRLKAYGETGFTLLKELVKKLSARILSIELNRGEERTAVSHLAMKLERVEGAKVWINILKAFGSEPFGRADYYYTSTYTRKEVLSRLLRICHPAETDTAQTLSLLVEQTDISHERLIESAIYAPQWLEITEEYTGWKGLQSVACFFHAHVNRRCDHQTAALIARFTSIRREDLCMGAFDIHWYRRVYREIKVKRFGIVLRMVENIASGSDYVRLSRFLDAVNGKTDAPSVRKQVEEKRNRDLLMMYGLIPLNKRSDSDLIERYRYYLQFLRESKLFGSQRQESEKKAVELGMINLACNAGYADVCRLTWSIETRTFKQLQPSLAPFLINEVKVYLKADVAGKPGVHYFKAGKELIHIPGKLRKDPSVIRLRETCKQLRTLYAHSQDMLERMLDERIPFLVSELQAFRKNPFVWPWLKSLVFITQEGEMGFCTDEGLQTAEGEILPQTPLTEVCLAHPVDLYNAQTEETYRTYIHTKGIEQPIEQVFRKRYAKTEEEVNSAYSLRYAGKQILADKVNTILKARRWVSVDDEKWQKVYYKEDVAALIETQSGVLSITDPEQFCIQRVIFSGRRSNRSLPISEVPDRVFSEIMRDIGSSVL